MGNLFRMLHERGVDRATSQRFVLQSVMAIRRPAPPTPRRLTTPSTPPATAPTSESQWKAGQTGSTDTPTPRRTAANTNYLSGNDHTNSRGESRLSEQRCGAAGVQVQPRLS
jgi:hypothetical protein